MREDQYLIETQEQFDAKWRTAQEASPARMMAEVDADTERERRQRVNERLRQQYS